MPATRTASAMGVTTGAARVPCAIAAAVRPSCAGSAVPAVTPAVICPANFSAPLRGTGTPMRVRSCPRASDGCWTLVPKVRLNRLTSGSATAGATAPAAMPAKAPGTPPTIRPAVAPATGSVRARVTAPATPAVVVSGSSRMSGPTLAGAVIPGAAPGITPGGVAGCMAPPYCAASAAKSTAGAGADETAPPNRLIRSSIVAIVVRAQRLS